MSTEIFIVVFFFSFLLIIGLILFVLLRFIKKEDTKTVVTPEKTNSTPIDPTIVEKFKLLFPLKLQAYERIVLFLERIEPSNLVMRNNNPNLNYSEQHTVLLNAIIEEFEHNTAQQIYVSESAWNLTKQAKEETINILNISANEMGNDSTSTDLSRKIFEKMMLIQKSPSQIALEYIRLELKEVI